MNTILSEPFRRLTYFPELFRIRFDELDAFVKSTERGASHEFEQFTSWFKKETDGLSDDEVEEVVDRYYDELATTRDTIPHLIRRSHLLVIYGAYEYHLALLCRVLHMDGVTKKEPKANIHMGDAKEYLRKDCKLPERIFGTDWKFMDSARGVRNAIAHNNGIVRNDAAGKRAKTFIRKDPDLALVDGDSVVVSSEFIQRLWDHAHSAISLLITEAKKRF